MKKSNLDKLASKSSLMSISVKHGDELINFNLYDELQIDDTSISRELKKQPTSYSFLLMLQTKLSELWSKAKADEEKTHDKLYLRYKRVTNHKTGRANSDDVAKAMVTINPIYIKARDKTIALSKQYGTIANCVRAFEQRSSLLQTLSANNRKQI